MEIKKLLSDKGKKAVNELTTMEILNPLFYEFNSCLTIQDKQLLTSLNQIIVDYTTDVAKSRPIVTSTNTAIEFFDALLKNESQEKLMVAFLDTKHYVIDIKVIFIGTVNSAMTHPREIFREAIKFPTVKIIIAHNHPSGDATPSSEDIRFTKRIIDCGTLMGIELLDHIIVGKNESISLREEMDNIW